MSSVLSLYLAGQKVPAKNEMNDAQIQREFSAFGLAPQRDAIIYLRNYLSRTDNPEGALQAILDRIPSFTDDALIRKSVIESVVSAIRTSESPTHHVFGYQQSFEMPKFSFESGDRSLVKFAQPSGALGKAADKEAVYIERYQILKTCLLHTHLFQASSLQFNIGSGTAFQISPVSSLLSKTEEEVIVLGYLDCDGETVTLEDPTGGVEVDITQIKQAPGIFAVGSIVVVNGTYSDSTVHAALIGHPPATTYEVFEANYWKLPTDPFGWELTHQAIGELKEMLATDHRSSLVLVFSDVWVDVPGVVDNFNYVLSQYDKSPPNIIVICGSFTSTPFSFDRFAEFSRLFNQFCEVIKRHDRIYERTQIVIVPSLNDLAAPHVFPRLPLQGSLSKMLDKARFMTNPCRMRFLNQTITIFRDDLLKRLSSSAVLPIQDKDAYKNMLTTIIDQRHLCPVDLEHAPISWPYDHALRLFPQPDVLIIADSCPAWAEKYMGCCAFNPGQFGISGTFIRYFPAESKAEVRSV